MPDTARKKSAPATQPTQPAPSAQPAQTDLFLANLSHELRNPLNAIIGFSEAIMHGYAEGARTKEYVADIHSSAEHMLAMVNDILDLSKSEAGMLELYEEDFDLKPVMERCAQMARPQLTKGVALNISAAEDLRIRGDERLCSQITLNLLSNSAKFTESGEITLTAERAPGGETVIRVKDTGCGVTPAAVDKIWEPFVQDTNPAHRRRRGAGLGLQLVRRFAELHGARADIESVLGEGTCMTVTFPPERAV